MNQKFKGRHTAANPDWYTQESIVEAARRAMGSIDTDPATDTIANKRIKAKWIFTEKRSGLRQVHWAGNVFLNPPGGQVGPFWLKLIEEYHDDNDPLSQAIWIGYSLEQLQVLQRVVEAEQLATHFSHTLPQHFAICYPKARLEFEENDAKRIERLKKIDKENRIRRKAGLKLRKRKQTADSPSHANYIVYLGSNVERFQAAFKDIGVVVVPR